MKKIEDMKPWRVQVVHKQGNEIQEALFAKGGRWMTGDKQLRNSCDFMFWCAGIGLTHAGGVDYFSANSNQLLHPHEVLARINACDDPAPAMRPMTLPERLRMIADVVEDVGRMSGQSAINPVACDIISAGVSFTGADGISHPYTTEA